MSFRLFDAPLREPSQFVGFAGNTIDRQSENRADDSVYQALTDPRTRLLLMNGGRLYLKLGNSSLDPWFGAAESQPFKVSLADGVLLGFSALAASGFRSVPTCARGEVRRGADRLAALSAREGFEPSVTTRLRVFGPSPRVL